jgi:2-keto-4-pentenoate hydratase
MERRGLARGRRVRAVRGAGLTPPWDDERVARGMRAQLERRRARLEAGDEPLGWKIGFGSPSSLERLALEGPLVGFLTRASLVASGSTVSVGRWTSAAAEPELALYVRADVAGGAGRKEARAAIGSLGPALELADVAGPTDDVEEILAGNIFHRAAILGPASAARAAGCVAGLEALLVQNGREVARTSDVEALTGEIVGLVCHVAEVLAAFGERLRAGDVVIAGSVVPPLSVSTGDDLQFELVPLGAVAVSLGP